MIAFARMNRIVEIDLDNELAVVEPGVVNLDITLAVQGQKYFLCSGSIQPACLHHRRQHVGDMPGVRTRLRTALRPTT